MKELGITIVIIGIIGMVIGITIYLKYKPKKIKTYDCCK